MTEPQNPIVTTGMALAGKPLLLTDIPETPVALRVISTTASATFSNYMPPEDIDYGDLVSINRELVQLRIRLNTVRQELRTAEREVIRTKHAYNALKRRTLIGLSGGTEKSREAAAELLSEREYTDFLVADSIAKELTQHNRDLRIELDALKELSNNLRRLIDLN
jgi:hypothetical protein